MVRLSDETAKPYEDASPDEWPNGMPFPQYEETPCSNCGGCGDVWEEGGGIETIEECPACDGLGRLP